MTKDIRKRIRKRWLARGFTRYFGEKPNRQQLRLLDKDYRTFKTMGVDAVRVEARVMIEEILTLADMGDAEYERETANAEGAAPGGLGGTPEVDPQEPKAPVQEGNGGPAISD